MLALHVCSVSGKSSALASTSVFKALELVQSIKADVHLP